MVGRGGGRGAGEKKDSFWNLYVTEAQDIVVVQPGSTESCNKSHGSPTKHSVFNSDKSQPSAASRHDQFAVHITSLCQFEHGPLPVNCVRLKS